MFCGRDDIFPFLYKSLIVKISKLRKISISHLILTFFEKKDPYLYINHGFFMIYFSGF